MEYFLIDEQKKFTYTRLLDDINSKSGYCHTFQTDELYDYFVNYLFALSHNKDLTLVDSTNTVEELASLGLNDVNVVTPVNALPFKDVDSLLRAVLDSESTITIFTSGTTGQPKKVVHSIKNLTRAVRISERHSNDVWGYAYNPTHMAGLQVFFQAFANHNTFVNLFNKQRCEVYNLIGEYQITHISATPTFYRLLLPFEKEYPSLKRITMGGEKSGSQLYENILKIFPAAKVTNIYASTEAGSLFAAKGENFQIPAGLKDKFKVEDGELLIHKSLLGTSDSFKYKGDYYCSGDLIEWVNEEEGLFKIVSRKNAMLNIGGYKVNPEEVEDEISKIEGVEQAYVYGRANSVLGTILCADVKKQDDAELTVHDIRQALAEKLQDFKVPRKIKFVEDFELTRTGKLKRS